MGTSYATGDVVAGKYRLERQLASGGMGQVWAARHVDLDTLFAVKFIDPAVGDREAMRNRFVREAKTAAKVRSPHIVTIHDFGTDGDVMYIAMELLEGEDLGTRLTREKRLSVAMAARIVRDAARGLGRAHEAGIVHRDLKPRNLFMARDGDHEIVKLLDFGVAKASWAEGGDTKTGEIVGSPHYMSPEQVHGSKEVDHRADLWSLAVILFRAITGKRPFKGKGVGEVIVEISTGPRRVASELVPGLPRGLDGFFERALARDPNDRFQSAAELATELAFVTGTADTLADISFPRAPASMRSSPSGSTEVIPQPITPDEDAPTMVHTPSIEEIAEAVPRSGPPEDGAAPRAPIEPEPPSERPAADTSPSASSYGSLASLQQSLEPPPPPPNRGAFVAVGVAGIIAVGVIAGIMASAPATGDESSTPVETAGAQAAETNERTEETREEAHDTPEPSASAVDPVPEPTRSAKAEKKPKARAAAGPRPQAPPAAPKPKSDEERRRLGY